MYSNDLVIKILIYINNNINKKITMDELSHIFYFNKDYLMRVFKKELDITIMDYINKVRIYNSLNDLKKTDDFIIKIALNNGYSSQEYFCEMFTKIIGVNPLTYRKFTRVNSQISECELNLIRKNLAKLFDLINKINAYRLNVVPASTIKRLSLFK